jgi:uncharacterized coiled-coil protein SlyX
MNSLIGAAKAVGVIVGAALSVISFLAWTNEALIEHLAVTFATKQDVMRVEQKLDAIGQHIEDLYRSAHEPRASSKPPR